MYKRTSTKHYIGVTTNRILLLKQNSWLTYCCHNYIVDQN